MIASFAVCLALFSLCAIVPLKYRQLKAWAPLYWIFSVTGQLFVVPILLSAGTLVLAGGSELTVRVPAVIALLAATAGLLRQFQVRRLAAAQAASLGIANDADFRTRWVDIGRWLLVLRCQRRGLLIQRDLAYGELPEQRLDIYHRSQTDEPRPILIHIHGGAWVAGKKGQMGRPLVHDMATAGWLVFDIEYRLGPEHRYPAMIVDVLTAIAWVKKHAPDYGGRADFITLSGGSAGGHLSTLAAALDQAERASLQAGFAGVDTRVQAIAPFYGRYDFLDRFSIIDDPKIAQFMLAKVMPVPADGEGIQLWRQASPIDHVGGQLPPCLLVHGSADCMIDVAEAQAFVAAQQPLSKTVFRFVEVPGAQHAFDLGHSPQTDALNRLVFYFLQDQFQSFLQSRAEHPVRHESKAEDAEC
nr:alpha/beta hydrolase [Pseudomaricurvus alcaniphilus]